MTISIDKMLDTALSNETDWDWNDAGIREEDGCIDGSLPLCAHQTSILHPAIFNKKAFYLSTLARELISSFELRILDGQIIMVYEPDLGCFIQDRNPLLRIHTALSSEIVANLNVRDFKDLVELIRISDDGRMRVTADQFNSSDHLLNCENGVIDLERGCVTPHTPHIPFTYCVHAQYLGGNEAVSCPSFEQFCETLPGAKPGKAAAPAGDDRVLLL